MNVQAGRSTKMAAEVAPSAAPLARSRTKSAGGIRRVLRRLVRHRGGMLGASILCLLSVVGIFAPQVAPYDPMAVAPVERLQGPNLNHWMGTDEIGRDLFSRVVFGTRISLWSGIIATGISTLFGVAFGLLAGYRGGWLEIVIMRLADVMLALPGILLAMTVVAALGTSLVNVMIAIGLAGVPRFTRLIRACAISAKENLYVEAARSVGCRELRIAALHILPNIFAPALVLSTVNVAGAILTIASLTYLGMGAQPPTPEWGLLLKQGHHYMRDAWWLTTFPGIAIMVSVLSINLLGDGLRDVLDPHMRN